MTNSHRTWSGTLALGRGIVVYVGPGSSAATHRHDATQLIWSPTNPIRVHTEHASTTTRAALIPPRQSHGFDADANDLAIVLVEPSGPLGQQLARLAAHHSGPELEARLTDIRLPETNDAASTLDWSRQVLAATVDAEDPNSGVRARREVLDASQFIDDHLAETPLLTAAADHVGLSSRQLRRSFTSEIGIPFRRYVLWRRLRGALLAVDNGADLTTAAATAGFADSAHFSRTFRQTFGLTPSDVLPLVTVAEADFPEP
jgi:AraC-like DNA-binding protein